MFSKGEKRLVVDMSKLFTCDDMDEAGLWDTRNCCNSCHEDEEYGYSYLLGVEIPDGGSIECCCYAIDRAKQISGDTALFEKLRNTKASFMDVLEEIQRTTPEEVWKSLPTDGAEEHDHYIYGTPKRNSNG